MNKEEYLTRLQYCISQLPPVEAQNTMQYYREYFDDAGEESFASVMAELGTPEPRYAAAMELIISSLSMKITHQKLSL